MAPAASRQASRRRPRWRRENLRALSQERVDDAVDRARLRRMVERPGGERISDEVIDQLLAGARTEEEIAGPGGLLAQLTKRLVERAMEVELTDHLGYEPHAEPPGGTGNTRNGTSPKTLVTEHGQVPIEAPARSRRELRAADRPQAPAALRGVRRQDPRALQPRALDAGHRGAPGGDLRREGRPRADLKGHRRRDGRRRARGPSGRWRTSTRSSSSTRWC